jgi:crotonobetainyl-CoA:carnitine CoA-transferase CaiB-like acyl-CoA transferase
VLPIDPETGEGLLFRALNRGKKSLTLNLQAEEGRDILLGLVETADVLLDSFRPGVMDRLGLGYEVLADANPRIIYCSLSGYGPEGPYRMRAGHDLNYQGLAGLLDLTGPRGGPPSVPGATLADLSGAMWATVGILLALLERERTGVGQRVDGSLLGGALAMLPLALAHHRGGLPLERGAGDLNGGMVCYNVYKTRDGKYMTLSALEPEFWAVFCQATEREELLEQQFAPAISGEPAYEEICALFASRTRDEWTATLEGVDACCDPVYSLGEALASAPVRALGMVGEAGLLPPVILSACQGERTEQAPTLSQHTEALLAELGHDAARFQSLRERGIV